jgi:outer membrane usher protein FimD/PapC
MFIIVALAGGGCEFSYSTARIADAKLSKAVNDKTEAVNPTSTFDSSDPIIHCVVQLANAPEDTKLKARWVAVKADGVKENEKLVETDISAGGSQNIVDFTLKPSGSGLPPGEYKVDIYLNPKTDQENQPDKTVTFTVKSSGFSGTRAVPSIAQAVLSTDPDGDTSLTTFAPDTEKIYCIASLRDAAPGTKVGAAWIAVEAEGVQPNYEIVRPEPVILEAGQNIYTTSFTPSNSMPAGRYQVDLYLNDSKTPARSIPFTVTSQ